MRRWGAVVIAAIIILTMGSWFLFPGWRDILGGFWSLLGIVTVAVVGVYAGLAQI
jgi:hypothetical protein